jgi:hypothetical protein
MPAGVSSEKHYQPDRAGLWQIRWISPEFVIELPINCSLF